MAKEDADEQVETPELTQEEQETQDALLAVNGDVKGELKPNRPLDDEGTQDEGEEEDVGDVETDTSDTVADEGKDEEAATGDEEQAESESSSSESTPELTTEKDETGVYAPPTAEDPGEFKPGDYSFEVTTTDGKTRKINSIAQADELLSEIDQKPELISAYQFGILNRKSAVMEQSVATDFKTYEADKSKFEEQQAQTKAREDYLTQWQGEINYLRSKGELPAITNELNQADWTDPAVASQPGVKEALAVFKWMEEENNQRMAVGLPPDLSVVSAYNSMQLDAMRNAGKQTETEEKDLTRRRGAMVGKKAPYTPSSESKGTLVGPARGLEDLATEAYYAEAT